MKELSVEKKAKAYDEALIVAKQWYNDSDTTKKEKYILKGMFSELVDSEDEKIRKELLEHCKNQAEPYIQTGNECPQIQSWIAWLEKQGESYTKRDVDDAYLKGVTNTKNEIEKQYEANYQIRKDIATFIFNYKGDIKDRAKWIDYLGIKVSFAEKQGEQKETLCDKCRKEQPSHSCQDITELGRCAVEHEQKLADNIESKFHEGDWVVNNTTFNLCHVLKVEHGQYVCDDCSFPITKENEYHLWTIQDAKDGDVLAAQECYVIFKEIDGLNIKCYCTYHYMGFNPSFSINTLQNKTAFHPATKEQRDLLFQKMHEAGYEWNDEKKELKKIEQKFDIEIPFGSKDSELQEASYYIPEGFHAEIEGNRVIIKRGEQKSAEWSDDFEEEMDRYIEENFYGSADNGFFSNRTKRELEVEDVVRIGCHFAAWQKEQFDKKLSDKLKQGWGEEDEDMLQQVIADIEDLIATETGIKFLANYHRHLNWLKSLKERVQPQQKQEWSKEDEGMVTRIVKSLSVYADKLQYEGFCHNSEVLYEQINWLKSLRPQKQQEWNKQDIEMIDWLIRCCEKEHEELCNDRYGHQDIVSDLKRDCRKKWDWLESLKNKVVPQKQWKPSDKQMEQLHKYCPDNRPLTQLYQDLKKLMEE